MVSLVVVLIAVSVFHNTEARYEWGNTYYNRQILDQLDDYFHPWLYDQESGDRIRKLPRFRSPVCCGYYDEDMLEKEDQLHSYCYNVVFGRWGYYHEFYLNHKASSHYEEGWNVFNCNATSEVKEKMKCVHQCLWRQRGALDEKYNHRESEVRAYYRRSSSGEAWREDLLERAVDKCFGVYDSSRNPPPYRSHQCNAAHLQFSYCIWKEVHRNCPEAQWERDSQYCRRVRQYLKRRG